MKEKRDFFYVSHEWPSRVSQRMCKGRETERVKDYVLVGSMFSLFFSYYQLHYVIE